MYTLKEGGTGYAFYKNARKVAPPTDCLFLFMHSPQRNLKVRDAFKGSCLCQRSPRVKTSTAELLQIENLLLGYIYLQRRN